MHIGKNALALTLATACALSANAGGKPEATAGGKKAILVVSFGTSFDLNLKETIEATEKRIAAAFPEHQVRRAFTSTIVIKALKKKGIDVDTVAEALEKLKKEGVAELVVQPLHLIPGEEYHGIMHDIAPYRASFPRLSVGMPLLAETDGYFRTVDAIAASLPAPAAGAAYVFMGHGTHHPANSSYALVQMIIEQKGLPAYVGTVEGYPDLDWVIGKLEADGVKKVTLVPLMLVAGDHANNDMAGDEDDSWKSILTGKGFAVDVILRGLGSVSAVQDLYVERAAAAMKALDGAEEAAH